MSRKAVLEQPTAAFATTLARGLGVLECFAPDAPLLGNSAIAERLGLTRPTVARLTSTLAELGYLRYDSRAAKYRLGARVVSLAHPLLAGLRLRQLARPLMQDFAASLRGVVSIGVLDGTELIYLESARTSENDFHVPDIGSVLPLVRTAMGRALTSMLEPAEAATLLERIAAADPASWGQYGERFRAGVASCAAQGFCTAAGDLVSDIHAAGAPLLRVRGVDALAVNCSVPAFRLRPGEMETEIGPRLLALARTLRALMGPRDPGQDRG